MKNVGQHATLARSTVAPSRGERTTAHLKSLEIFSGAGGLALATHQAGFRHTALIEWNKEACQTLRANAATEALPDTKDWRVIEGDIREVNARDFAPVDLVAGGPPCQPFSIGGKHRGKKDSRDMIPEYTRIVRELTPRGFILENVKGLLRPRFRTYFSHALLHLSYPTVTRKADETWLEHLQRLEDVHTHGRFPDLHYHVVFRLLNAADHGVPQTRERVFMVGFRADTGIKWHFPEPTHRLETLLYDQWITGDYWKRHGLHRPREIPDWARKVRSRIPKLLDLFAPLPWRTVRDTISDLPEPHLDREPECIFNHRLNPGARAYVGHTGSPLDLPAKTLKAGDHGVPGGENMLVDPDGTMRYFTVREAARLQTFPDAWRFEGPWSESMRQLGNAVPVRLAGIIAESVAAALKGVHA